MVQYLSKKLGELRNYKFEKNIDHGDYNDKITLEQLGMSQAIVDEHNKAALRGIKLIDPSEKNYLKQLLKPV